ncbi:hypothetical protein BCON_0472g00040 [Botryotinia convoluta]|uniref:Uncharacterized protein n=1 Tax=Botryotinia convoluta TaxID=54673 RepID=A0A4Z1H6F5_9HELO|nr:hypothetical protein BCON_0472g00040 [Botryotinia convoluta]
MTSGFNWTFSIDFFAKVTDRMEINALLAANHKRTRTKGKISTRRMHAITNAARCLALVEPNVPMDRLIEATLKHGLIPPVVM